MADALSIGISALLAQQRAMEVTSHNIANMTTPGYSRQSVDLATNVPEDVQPGQVGRGVRVVSVKRASDALITEQVRVSMTESGRLDYINQIMQSVQSVFNEPSETGLSASVNQVFAALENLTNNPDSLGVRNTTVSALEHFTGIIRSMGDQLVSTREDLERQLALEVEQINNLTSQIAGLNQQISRETVIGNNPNDLLDRREQLINELSTIVDLRVTIDPRTQVANIQAGSLLLVSSNSALNVEAGATVDRIGLVASETGELVDVSGGRVGALIELSSERIPAVIDQLATFVQSFVNQINRIHTVGTNGNSQISEYFGETVIVGADYTVNLDDESLALGDNGIGIAPAYAPTFVDENGVSQISNLTINVRNTTTGIAEKYIIRYDPGLSSIPASRSMKDLVDAINTGTGGGFTVYGPQGVATPIANLTASPLQVSGGVRLSLETASGYVMDFSRALDTQPSSEAWNAATWTVGSPAVELRGRYSSTVPFDPTTPWTLQVLSGGTVGASAGAPVVRFNWYEDVSGVATPRTTDVTLDAAQGGKPVAIGAGVYAYIDSGTLTTGDSLNMIVDGAPDQAGLLGALGINTLLSGARADNLTVATAIAADSSRLGVAQTRVAGDNSNVLALAGLRRVRFLEGGTKTADDFIASLTSDIGSQVEFSERLGENQDMLVQSLQNRRDQESGVNIDEEVGALIKQQQAYTAAARIITSMQDNINTLMDLIR